MYSWKPTKEMQGAAVFWAAVVVGGFTVVGYAIKLLCSVFGCS